ncbi:MAG: hypothetical protein M3M94_05905, partial [Actinomycetota bacterium]|nr:hypothetical protein [Actinomycetota bacterium]
MPKRAFIALGVAVTLALIAAGAFAAFGRDSARSVKTIVDDERGGYGGVRVGDSAEDVMRVFGEP